jgi:hypothetical protein
MPPDFYNYIEYAVEDDERQQNDKYRMFASPSEDADHND